jgi:hypothetical protein
MKSSGTKVHCVIPDCQVKPGHPTRYLERIGQYIAEKKPDVIVQIGDFADMPSLSSYDKGKKSYEGRRYRQDVEAAHTGMESLVGPIRNEIARLRRNKERGWNPDLHLTLGNHEHRILRTIESESILDGTIGIGDLRYEDYGFRVHNFLDVVSIDGVQYSHYFTSGVMGRPVPNARQLVIKKLQSCVMGHNQHWDIHRTTRADGTAVIGLFVGSCYEHDEDYLGPQGNNYDRGIWMLYEVNDGEFQPHFISLKYLEKKYG